MGDNDKILQAPSFTWDQSVIAHLCEGCVTLLVISKTAGKNVRSLEVKGDEYTEYNFLVQWKYFV